MCREMYVPEPTNIPIEKTNRREYNEQEAPVWPTPSENDIIRFHRDMGHLQGDFRENRGSESSPEASLSSLAWVTVPIMTALVLIIALLLINQKKQWIPVSCYRAPSKQVLTLHPPQEHPDRAKKPPLRCRGPSPCCQHREARRNQSSQQGLFWL
uniref:Cysteine-rich motor neuron 1 protein n=1 Tax=Sphaerodactylus townsendi TaxID=933632 RepID=A0ACB8GBS1_9SAUR